MAMCTPIVKDFTKMEWRILLLALTVGLDGDHKLSGCLSLAEEAEDLPPRKGQQSGK